MPNTKTFEKSSTNWTHKFSQEIDAWQEDEEAFYGPELFSLYIRQTILEEVNPFEAMPKVAETDRPCCPTA